jgi:hypothetical protein
MDLQPTTTQAISDDQELAKVLAGVSKDSDDVMQFEDSSAPVVVGTTTAPVMPTEETVAPVITPAAPTVSPLTPAADSSLDSIKKDALVELRPLVDKLNLSPEEKFDTYLLLIRSTDDKALIAPAHEAAKGIADETKRAQALLDIIKEIDFLSAPAI